MEEITEGSVLCGRYRLVRHLGGGSFGEVWLCVDQSTNSEIALKICSKLNKDSWNKFQSLSNLTKEFSHQNLLKTYSLDWWNGHPILTMRYCCGGASSNLINSSALTENIIWQFIKNVSNGLSYLHENQIVHQDIKPDNILVDNDGTFLITDFDISRDLKNTISIRNGINLVGSTAYMAPEKFQNKSTPIYANDIWSLGVSIYEIAEGELPFSGMGGIMLKNGAEMPGLSSKWSIQLNEIMQKCLSLDPWDRPRANELVEISNKVLSADINPNLKKKSFVFGKKCRYAIYCIGTCIFISLLSLVPSLLDNAGENNDVIEVRKEYEFTEYSQVIGLLNQIDLTLHDINKIEESLPLTELKEQEIDSINKKIDAIRHIYLRAFDNETHDLKNLKNIYTRYNSIFSDPQKEVMDWFFQLPIATQMKWENSNNRCSSFENFKKFVETLN